MEEDTHELWANTLLGNYTRITEQQPTNQTKRSTRLSAVHAYQSDSATVEQLNHVCERQPPCSPTLSAAGAPLTTDFGFGFVWSVAAPPPSPVHAFLLCLFLWLLV